MKPEFMSVRSSSSAPYPVVPSSYVAHLSMATHHQPGRI